MPAPPPEVTGPAAGPPAPEGPKPVPPPGGESGPPAPEGPKPIPPPGGESGPPPPEETAPGKMPEQPIVPPPSWPAETPVGPTAVPVAAGNRATWSLGALVMAGAVALAL